MEDFNYKKILPRLGILSICISIIGGLFQSFMLLSIDQVSFFNREQSFNDGISLIAFSILPSLIAFLITVFLKSYIKIVFYISTIVGLVYFVGITYRTAIIINSIDIYILVFFFIFFISLQLLCLPRNGITMYGLDILNAYTNTNINENKKEQSIINKVLLLKKVFLGGVCFVVFLCLRLLFKFYTVRFVLYCVCINEKEDTCKSMTYANGSYVFFADGIVMKINDNMIFKKIGLKEDSKSICPIK